MRKIVLLLNLVLISTLVFGQPEKLTYKSVADSFEINYNADNFNAIFTSFSIEMQNALPIDKTKEFFTGLKQQAGNITKREFNTFNESYANYKTNFENGLFAVNISVDGNDKINGLFVEPFKENNPKKIERNKTKLTLPFNEEWTVIWGGDTYELNHHIKSEAQKYAFDIVITDNKGNSYRTDGKTNDDYYAFGKELIAPCDGEVVLVVDGIKDNQPGTFNPVYIPGNSVIIKTLNDEYLFFGHFKQYSIKVKQGQKIKEGKLLGLCGNSGNSSEPHLHFHIQDGEDMNTANGVKCYFEKIKVNGQIKTNYSPIQKDKITN